MTTLKKVFLCLAALIAVPVVGVIILCWERRVETYHDQHIKAGHMVSPANLFFVHLSEPTYLTFNHKTYKGVRGSEPYYLKIPELNSILFVTERGNDRVVFHIINLTNKEEIKVNGGTSGFGWHIGAGRKPGEKDADYIENVQSNKITMARQSLNWKELYVLNLDSKRFEKTEVFEYDQNGKLTNHEVHPKYGFLGP